MPTMRAVPPNERVELCFARGAHPSITGSTIADGRSAA